MSRTQFGLLLPILEGSLGDGRSPRWRDIREVAQFAEQIGIDTVWVADHLLFRRDEQMAIPVGESRGPWECFSLLSGLAEATSKVTLGPFVACTSFRNPALLAKIADALDEISGGRFLLGLGAGWHAPEYAAYGYPFHYRVSRFEEALQIIVPLLRDGHVDFQGKYYTARDCELRPRGPTKTGPPIWIGGSRPRMMGLVAKYADAYNTDFRNQPEEVAELFASLDQACQAIGRDPKTIAKTGALRFGFDDTGRTGGKGVQVLDFDVSGMTRTVIGGSTDELIAHTRAFLATGVEHLTLMPMVPAGVKGLERIAPILAAVRG